MLTFLLKGITYGLMLSILVGPILFALLQAAMEKGTKMGLMVGFGIWVSDFLYILAVYFGLTWIAEVSELPNFKFYLGVFGSILLVTFGIGTLFNNKPVDRSQKITKSGFIAHFVKGFLINTINPFTVFFWIGMSSEVLTTNTSDNQAIAFFIGIFSMIILTDSLKVLLAKQISKYLKLKHILKFRKIVGIVLIIGGIVLLYRSVI